VLVIAANPGCTEKDALKTTHTKALYLLLVVWWGQISPKQYRLAMVKLTTVFQLMQILSTLSTVFCK